MNTAYVNGEFCSLSDARISIFDRGFLFGDAVYEVLPVYNGQPYFLDRHLARLNLNLEQVKIKPPECDWNALIQRLITENNGGNLQVYLHITRGNQGVRKHDIPSSLKPSVIAFTIHNSYPTQAEKEKGLSALIVEDYRWMRCNIKATSLLANILLNDEAVSSGYDTAILTRDGVITEGSSSNVFMVDKNDIIKTPPLTNYCLPGITRQLAIELINESKLQFSEEAFTTAELFAAKEIWITSTTKEIFPVTRLDDIKINKGVPGEYWNTINQSYLQLVS